MYEMVTIINDSKIHNNNLLVAKPHTTRTNSTRTPVLCIYEKKTVQNHQNWTFLRRRRVYLTNQSVLVIRSDRT